ncbi:MAG: SGNH/GDSL hydrolase family protein [Actinoallomurus sp.]
MGLRRAFRRPAFIAYAATLLALGGVVTSAQTTKSEPRTAKASGRWAGTWEAAMAAAVDGGCAYCTIRDVVHTSIGGARLRVRLSNAFGTAPLLVGHTTVALPAAPGSAQVAPGTLREVRFHGRAAVTIAPGADAVSDPIPLSAPSGDDLLVTTYTPGYATPMSDHPLAKQHSFVARGVDVTDAVDASAFPATTAGWHIVTGVDVSGAAGTVVALGDSITDGYRSTNGADRRWPDVLARRLLSGPAYRRLGVLNAGIGGNRVLLDGGVHGRSAAERLDRDVLSRSGVRTVIVLEGINDIQQVPHQLDPTRITAGLTEIVARSHARGLRVIGGTLTPYGGCACYSRQGEATRQAVNAWIRTDHAFDGVVDFDAVLRDPYDPRRMRSAYDSGDHLHPSDAGYAAMGGAVDLSTL